MESSKSQVEFYLDLVCELICCDPLGLTTLKHLRRDVETVRSRTTKEGLSFLSKTLPKLGKALDQGLASTHFTLPSEFKHSYGNGSIPAFMQAYFKCVFDASGDLLDTVDPGVIKHLRQVLLFVYKLETPYSASDESRVIEAFVETEKELEFGRDIEASAILAAASYVTRDVFRNFNPKDIIPRHGPGAVATGERLDDKWSFNRLYSGIHQVFPYYDYFIVGRGKELIDRLAWYRSLERLETGVAKVVLVPKDSRGPRLISCEPLEYQWIQQGLGRKLVAHLESSRITGGQVNFTLQSVNRDLAQSSSLDRAYATLDMKEASDRVSLELVKEVFSQTPELLRALEAARTTATTLPDGRVVPLKKFAPMGSAICFPIEAYIFWVLLVAAISRFYRLQPSEVGKRLFVYGDDLIIPTEWADFCIQSLERFALKVNRAKCCIKGPFRESCGMDAFKGVCVTPLRLKKLWTGRPGDGAAYASYVALANGLAAQGYVGASDLMWRKLARTYGTIPYGTSQAAFPCRIVDDPNTAEEYNSKHFRTRSSVRYQRKEFLLKGLRALRQKTGLDGWLRLLRDMVSGGGEDPSSVVVPRSTQIKRGWTPVY